MKNQTRYKMITTLAVCGLSFLSVSAIAAQEEFLRIKVMKKLFIGMFLAILSITATPLYANDAHHQAADNQKSYSAKGEVVAVDRALSKVKLKHDPVPELK